MRLFIVALFPIAYGTVASSATEVTTPAALVEQVPRVFSHRLERAVSFIVHLLAPHHLKVLMNARGLEGLVPDDVGPLVAGFVQQADLVGYPDVVAVSFKTGAAYKIDKMFGALTEMNPRIRCFLEFVCLAVRGARGTEPDRYRAAMIERYSALSTDAIFEVIEMFDYQESPDDGLTHA